MASRGSWAESLKSQSEPSNFPSRNGGRRDDESMGLSAGPGVVWEGRHPQAREHSEPQQGPRAPRAVHADMTRAQPHGGCPQPHNGGENMCRGSGLVQGGAEGRVPSEVRGMS